MEHMHPMLVMEVATVQYQERLARSIAAWQSPPPELRAPSPRATIAHALVSLADWLAPNA